MTAILPLTGPSGDLGRSVANGMKLAEKEINASTTGTKLKLVIEDSKGKPDEAVTAYRALTATQQTPVVLSWMSSVARALAPLAPQDHVALFVGAAVPGLTVDSGLVIRVWPKAEDLGDVMGKFAAGKRLRRLAIAYINDDYGRSVADAFAKVVAQSNAVVVAKEPLEIGQSDFRVLFEKIKAQAPDGLFVPAYGNAYVQGLKQAREILGNSVTLMADLTLLSSFTRPQLGNETEGIIVPATALDLEPRPNEVARRFAATYKAEFGIEADFNSGLGYMMFLIAGKGLISGGPSGKAVAEYITKTETFDGPLGTIKFDAMNDCTIPIQVAIIRNGQAQPLP